MFDRFANSARLDVFFARYEALAAGAVSIQPHHFSLALERLHPEMASIAQAEAPQTPPAPPSSGDDLRLSEDSKQILRSAAEQARRLWLEEMGHWRGLRGLFHRREWQVDSRHLLLALMLQRGSPTEEVRARLFAPGALAPTVRGPVGLLSGEQRRTGKLATALLCAQYEANRLVSGSIRPEHLLLGLIFASVHLRKPKAAVDLFGPIGTVRQEVEAMCLATPPPPAEPDPDTAQTLKYAAEEATARSDTRVGTGHLMLGLLRVDHRFPKDYLNRRGIQLDTARAALSEPDLL